MALHDAQRSLRLGLDVEICREKIKNARTARVVITDRCLPSAYVVHVVVRDHTLYVTSDERAVVAAARRGDVVTVQADGVEPTGELWSVQATGMSWLTTHHGGGDVMAVPMTLLRGELVSGSFPEGN